jgi:hypothetical protein
MPPESIYLLKKRIFIEKIRHFYKLANLKFGK